MSELLGFVLYGPATSEPAQTETAATNGAGGMTGIIIWLVIMVGLFYFMIVFPQKRREKKFKQMMEKLKVGDRVVSAGGIIGKVTNMEKNTVRIRTGKGAELDLTRRSITAILGKQEGTENVEPDVEQKNQ
ncbi:MAG: preprotein translocase subunit YajC [Kosmotogaceae bacterium]